MKDANGNLVEGFKQVRQIMPDFYKNLLGQQYNNKKAIDLKVINKGPH